MEKLACLRLSLPDLSGLDCMHFTQAWFKISSSNVLDMESVHGPDLVETEVHYVKLCSFSYN